MLVTNWCTSGAWVHARQYEVVVPLLVQERDTGGWNRGLGDVAFAVKHVLAHSLGRGHILSAAGELILPTGKEGLGLGSGVTTFEPFVTFGQLLPADSFVQAQAGLELPFDTDRAGREAFWRVAIGKTFTQGRFGRAWSPMVEWLAAREPRGWGQGAVGCRAADAGDAEPTATPHDKRRSAHSCQRTRGPQYQVITYFLWDWFDGGLLDGWR